MLASLNYKLHLYFKSHYAKSTTTSDLMSLNMASNFRYNENREILKSGMAKLGFQEFVAEKYAGYIITSYLTPSDLKSDFDQFHEKLSQKGQVIYPGKVTDADTFRIGNIGHLFPQDMKVLLNCIEKVLQEMNVSIPVKY